MKALITRLVLSLCCLMQVFTMGNSWSIQTEFEIRVSIEIAVK